MAVQAIAKGVQMSPRKVAVVAALVRGRSVADALTILEHTPRRSALAVAFGRFARPGVCSVHSQLVSR